MLLLDQDTPSPPSRRPPSRRLSLAPEILSLVFSLVVETSPADAENVGDGEAWRIRNATLAAAALVSKDWSAAAVRELYGDLRIEWVGRRRKAIIAAFRVNPDPHSKVRKITAQLVTFDEWIERWNDPNSEERADVEDVAGTRWPPERSREEEHEAEEFEFARFEVFLYLRGESGWRQDARGSKIFDREVADSFWIWAGQNSVSAIFASYFLP